jgi:hypothetical protein
VAALGTQFREYLAKAKNSVGILPASRKQGVFAGWKPTLRWALIPALGSDDPLERAYVERVFRQIGLRNKAPRDTSLRLALGRYLRRT